MAAGHADDWTVPGYLEERRLGAGASGRVVAAVSEATGERVAIKYLSAALVGDPAFMWRFRAEAALQRSLDVPQIVQVFDYVEEPGRGAAIVMELVDGASLHQMIGQRGPASPEAALAVLKGSLLGLAAAHAAGIVHRDYKPENVLVDADGSSKLADFGVAVRAGKRQPTAGTPLYMAPEQWNGAPSSPATDIYAAAAVFFECLTGATPFTGRLPRLRQLHATAAVPVDTITAPPLRDLITRGMAKNPADRPQGAIAFVSELESAAAAAYGPDWEERGRGHLAVRAAALLPLLLAGGGTAGSSGTSTAVSWPGGHKVPHAARAVLRAGHRAAPARRKALAVASIAAAAVVVAGVGAAVALTGKHSPPSHLAGDSSVASTTLPTVQAAVLPPVAASHCTAPASFRYQGTITAAAPGAVSYRWVYSSGRQGPVQTADFAKAGGRQVTGETVTTKAAGTGWAEIKMISPAATTSNKASYRLLCAGAATGVSAAAAVTPATTTVTCGTPAPAFTATGSVTSRKAQTVSYYWSLSDGRVTPPATLTFTRPGTLPAQPFTITPLGDPTSGEAVLVVSKPVAVSAPAPYALSCDAPRSLAASVTVSPATETLTACTAAAPALTFSGTVSDNEAGPVSYHWELPGGNGPAQTLTFAGAGSQTVTTTYKPASDSASGSGSLVITSPASVTSNAAAFTVACGAHLTVAGSAPATATVGTAYSGTFTASGGKGTYTWGAVSGLPAGLTATASGATLTISGTPAAAGSFTVPVSVRDSAAPPGSGTASLALTVSEPALTVTSSAPATATVGTAYSGTVTASGGNGTYTWGAVSGLPAGLTATASGATLTISGTPTAPTDGAATATVTASDTEAAPKSASAAVTITVGAPTLAITTTALPSGQSWDDYSAAVTAAGGTGAYAWSAAGLPNGLAIGPATGTISGALGDIEVADDPGTYPVTVTVTDGAGASASTTLSLVITPQPLTLELSSLPAGTSGVAYSWTFNADFGTTPYQWAATGLPAGLSISSVSATDAQIAGTPAAVATATTYPVTVTVTDSAGTPASKTLSLVISPAPVIG
jgi:serine/threonine-protein kinase